MAVKKVYIGSIGPFLFDDTDLINDQDGDFAGETQKALTTDGQLVVQTVPVGDDEVKRLADEPGAYLILINGIVTHEGSVVVYKGDVVTS